MPGSTDHPAVDAPDAAPPSAVGVATVVVDPRDGVVVRVAGTADATTGRPLTASTPMHLCSAAKTVAAVVVLRLAARGLLALDADVRELVPVEVAVPGAAGPTLRDLLAHRGGVEDPPGAFEPAAGPAPATADVVAGRTAAHPGPVRVTAVPGTAFAYSDAGYCLVELAVEAATGDAFAEVVHREVARPLGLNATAVWAGEVPPPGAARGDAVARIAASAAAGHRPDGTRVPGGRVHYAGLAASSLWSTPEETGVLLADLVRCWSGSGEGVLLGGDAAAPMLDDAGEPGVGRGVFVLGSDERPCIMTQGWGDGFQCQLRGYPAAGGGIAVLVDQDPGEPQARSVVGRTIGGIAGRRGWVAR
ncbi:serine hydrolase domain-containing protein [Cellulomonas sp. ES6]|uniref:serine hydrolase domain-containing protein n=1 Tax=Cellulomonas sp. ES6 TaxID=3039384 RepID=UPI0024B7414B|nr:serine hydrolase domain-containing protein [Cellulomonas sp. ES6]WHP19308.1 serine hydrolase domain-containing protein [Cellulomonas sp. ES6]